MRAEVMDGCISCGLCAEEYPALFQMNGEGIAEPVSPQVPAGMETQAAQAAEDCPVHVILLSE